MEKVPAFNARQISNVSFDRLYRVYASGSRLHFIRIGGQGGIWEGAAHPLGIVRRLLESRMNRRAEMKEKALIDALDEVGPEQLLSAHEDNFRLAAAELADGSIDPPSFFATHGPHVGRCRLSLADGRKLDFQIERTGDMRIAMDVLSEMMSSRLRVNVRWNESVKRYEKGDDAA